MQWGGTISDCHFVGNSAAGAGGGMAFAWGFCIPSIQNCTFENNTAPRGGGLAVYEQHPSIVNCTFYGNTATTEAGGIYIEGESVTTMERTIVSFSPQGEAIVVEDEGSMTLTCCDLYGNAGGDWIGSIADQYGINGNISRDPLFCDAGSHDFTLQAISPCAPFSNPNPECDLIGAWPVACGYGDAGPDAPRLHGVFLSQAVPNPLTRSARFAFSRPASVAARVTLQIHDAMGRVVRALASDEREAGMQNITWNGCDDAGRLVPAGVYYCRLDTGAETVVRTVTVVR